MRSETRLVLFTNDAVILGLAAFPYYIGRWGVKSLATKSVVDTTEAPTFILSNRVQLQLRCKLSEGYMPIEKRVSLLPPGFTPKINWMECITGDAGHHRWVRDTVHPRFSTEDDYLDELVGRIREVWNGALKVSASGFYEEPRMRTPSVLLLDRIGGDPEKARDVEYLWPIYEEIIVNGNELARTPICEVMDRKEVKRSVWEYSPREEPR